MFKIIQITDTHLFQDNQIMHGANCNLTFANVIEHIKKNEMADANAIFLTGDLSQDESEKSYQILAEALSNIDIPIFWIPGNHDSIETMKHVFDDASFIQAKMFRAENWEFIFLNTKKDDTHEGYLSDSELSYFKNELAKIDKKKSVAVIMHHHPIEVGTPMMDSYILINKKEFWDAAAKRVKLVICGHVHNDYSFQYGTTNIEAAPATCMQWTKGATGLDKENLIGYKTYLFEDGNYSAKAILWENQENKS